MSLSLKCGTLLHLFTLSILRIFELFDIFVYFQTPLHFAADNGKLDVVEILLRNGANINEKDVRNHRNK